MPCTTVDVRRLSRGQNEQTFKPTILIKILGTSHKIALLRPLITCFSLTLFQSCLNQTPFDHFNIELGGKEEDQKLLSVCFRLDILGNITKPRRFACVPANFDQDCRKGTADVETLITFI